VFGLDEASLGALNVIADFAAEEASTVIAEMTLDSSFGTRGDSTSETLWKQWSLALVLASMPLAESFF
jgi:hypothetical protein